MHIRQERPEDYAAVERVVKEAFAHAECSDGHEQDLVAALRRSGAFVPELSLIALEDKVIAGHILFTRASVNGAEVLALAPLSVLPAYRNRGIGLSLIARRAPDRAQIGLQLFRGSWTSRILSQSGLCSRQPIWSQSAL